VPDPPERPGRSRLLAARRWLVASAIVVIALLTVAGVFGYVLARSAPAWWRTVDRDDPGTGRTAEMLQNALGNQFTAVRAPAADLAPGEAWRSEVWRFAVEVDDANAWLNTSLRDWIKSDPDMPAWPEDIGSVQIAFGRGLIFVGVEVIRAGGSPQYLAAAVRPSVHDDGSLWVPADRVLIGRLPIPPEVVLSQAQSRVDRILPEELTERGQTLLRVFGGTRALAESPVISLGDGRQVRILDIAARNRRLIVSCRTELRDGERASLDEPRP
jgi:hypothetical protein